MASLDIWFNKGTCLTVYPSLSLEPLLVYDSTEQPDFLSGVGLRAGVEVTGLLEGAQVPKDRLINSVYFRPTLTLRMRPSAGLHLGVGLSGYEDNSGARLLGFGVYGEKELEQQIYHVGIESGVFFGSELGGGVVTYSGEPGKAKAEFFIE